MNNEYKNQTEYNEINLIDYLRIILKRKKIILVFLLIGMILGWAVTLSLPKNYKAETILEIGRYGQRPDTKISASQIINPNELLEKINYGFYGNYPNLKVINLENTNLIEIEITAKDSKIAEDSLKRINELILEEHNKKLKIKIESLEKAAKELEEKIKSLNLRNQETAIFELEIYYIKSQIKDFQPTKALREPTIIFSRQSNLFLNLIFGGILGIFSGFFLVSFQEWWQKNKEKLSY